MNFYNSQYNFSFEVEEGYVFYNARTGAVFLTNASEGKELKPLLVSAKQYFDENAFEDTLLNTLFQGGFLLPEIQNELSQIQEQYWRARGETPMVLTITTTMDCNLGCYYCYESRTKEKLEFSDIPQVVSFVEKRINENAIKSLHVDWYGGEPLLNLDFLEKTSAALQHLCAGNAISFHASIISNGTLWPEDVGTFIRKNKIRQVQISIDGLADNHNKRRRYRSGFDDAGQPSFDLAMNVIEKLLDVAHVDLRFNIDWKNRNDLFPFIDLIEAKGWFRKKYPLVFQPARLSAYTEKSAFMQQKQLTQEEFDDIRQAVAVRLKNQTKVEESEVPDGFPFPKTYVCAALAKNSFVLGADNLIYRCGLQVGEKHRAVGSLYESNRQYEDEGWWQNFDPCTISSCSKCSFLPVCWGGCPKRHLEKNGHSLDEQSEYWKNNLYSKVVHYVGCTPNQLSVLTQQDQFREGY